MVVSVFNARGNVFEQIQVHAQDTATSLGLTISHVAEDKDEAQIGSFIDVVFDRGYYREISYKSLSGEISVVREQPIVIEGVPQWFVDVIELPLPTGHSEVVSGWFRLGEVLVVTHPGFAYRDLWRTFNEQLWLFLVTAVLSYGLAGVGLGYLLRPLKKVEDQAEAICRREFPIQEQLPKTPELKRMVLAMNRMVRKIQAMFQEQVELTESLHRQAYLDPVTQLSNRRDFDSRFEAFIKSEQGGSPGLLMLIQVGGMQAFNDRFGRSAGDQCLKDIARVLEHAFGENKGAILSRRGGADLCVFCPALERSEAEEQLQQVFSELLAISWFEESEELGLHAGAAFSEQVMLGNKLLEQADLALRQAQHQGRSGLQWFASVQQESGVRSAGEWRSVLQAAISDRRFAFQLQPVFAVESPEPVYHEVLCRLRDGDALLSAGVFLPMAERFGLLVEIDKLMLQELAEYHRAHSEQSFCVNISLRSVIDGDFMVWLKDFLATHQAFASQLLLKLPEQALSSNEAAVRELAALLVASGAGLSLDHFGASASAFHYLQSMPLRGLKIDRCFVQGIDSNPDNQFFVKSLLQIAHSCDLKLFAEGVETDGEWSTLMQVGVDGGQGYHLGKPESP
ncbi:MAG: EAL domain-containing protein [Candidatus Pelagadaptatus aseana]